MSNALGSMVQLRLYKKTFNVLSCALITQLQRLFTDGGPVLNFLKGEIETYSKSKLEDHVPGAKFFATMNTQTTIERGTEFVSVGELVLTKDERLFNGQCGVEIPELQALGIVRNWPTISTENRNIIWDYLIRMAKTSARIVITGNAMTTTIVDDIESLVKQFSSEQEK